MLIEKKFTVATLCADADASLRSHSNLLRFVTVPMSPQPTSHRVSISCGLSALNALITFSDLASLGIGFQENMPLSHPQKQAEPFPDTPTGMPYMKMVLG